jgi:hypothetical protein
MRRAAGAGFPLRGTGFVIAIVVAVTVLLVLPVGSLAASEPRPTSTERAASNGVSGSAYWDGTNVQTASSPSAAFQIQFNGAVNINYTWTSLLSTNLYTVNDARLQIFYFGFALATRDVTNANPMPAAGGTFTMNWTTGPLQYVLEGTYRVVASLLEPNGTTVWSQSFWVQVAAPFYILAAFPIVLILIIIYELYAVATVGRQATLRQTRKGNPPAASPPAETSPTSSTSTTESAPPTPPPGGVP